MAHYVVLRTSMHSNQPWVWNLVADNGKTVGNNETFKTCHNALRAIAATIRNTIAAVQLPYAGNVSMAYTMVRVRNPWSSVEKEYVTRLEPWSLRWLPRPRKPRAAHPRTRKGARAR